MITKEALSAKIEEAKAKADEARQQARQHQHRIRILRNMAKIGAVQSEDSLMEHVRFKPVLE